MAPGQQSALRRPPPLGLVGLRPSSFTPPVGDRTIMHSGVPPANPVRRVGLQRLHSSSLVDSAGTGGGSGAGTAGGSGIGRAGFIGAGTAGFIGALAAGGSGALAAGGSDAGAPAGRGAGTRRRQLSRASSVVAADPPLNLGGGFNIDVNSSFFQLRSDGNRSSSFEQGESSAQGARRGFDRNRNVDGMNEENNASACGYRGTGYNLNFENADEFPSSQQHVQANPRPILGQAKVG